METSARKSGAKSDAPGKPMNAVLAIQDLKRENRGVQALLLR